ncbi:adenylyl-sulfate kinase [Halomonas sp. A29]|uniref:adenylyl-sulfate kinase n=1 Tax=Halomonas sp. A29 TaxID=3102786 RepID=UPI00398B913D
MFAEAGIIVITTFISPFRSDRDAARALFSEGDFIKVHVDTPLDVCEQRDPKGFYQKACEGKIKDFTGINSPYEVPTAAEITVNTDELRQQEIVGLLLKQL